MGGEVKFYTVPVFIKKEAAQATSFIINTNKNFLIPYFLSTTINTAPRAGTVIIIPFVVKAECALRVL